MVRIFLPAGPRWQQQLVLVLVLAESTLKRMPQGARQSYK